MFFVFGINFHAVIINIFYISVPTPQPLRPRSPPQPNERRPKTNQRRRILRRWFGTHETIRTSDPSLRRRMLYPLSYAGIS